MLLIKCDFCGSSDYDELYQPINTKRNNRVCVCNGCGLVFSIHDDVPYSREPTPSGDADWGNIRFCKGQRFRVIKDILPTDARYILDVGSSRGHFVKWAKRAIPGAEITAVEPDTRVIGEYADEFSVIGKYLEEIELPEDHFDFVYCMQTLEHTDSASAMLKQIYRALRPGGVLFVEVPNLEVIDYPYNVEEFFIDKHNFHFQRSTLCEYMMRLGYSIQANKDNLNVRILATKGGPSETALAHPADRNPRELIETYAANIARNRAKLPAVVEQVNEIMNNMTVAFFGGNTLFDLMVKYGGLHPERVECLIDDYLTGIVAPIHGVTVQGSEAFRIYKPDVCIVLARHSADAVAARARSFGVRNVVKFYDLLRTV